MKTTLFQRILSRRYCNSNSDKKTDHNFLSTPSLTNSFFNKQELQEINSYIKPSLKQQHNQVQERSNDQLIDLRNMLSSSDLFFLSPKINLKDCQKLVNKQPLSIFFD